MVSLKNRWPGLWVMFWRFATGNHMDGVGRTDSSFWFRGKTPLRGRASWWTKAARVERMGVRWAVVLTLAGGSWLYLNRPRILIALVVTIGFGIVVWASWEFLTHLWDWKHYRGLVKPLFAAVQGLAGIPPGAKPDQWVNVPRDYDRNRNSLVRIKLPDKFTGASDNQRAITEVVNRKLGMVGDKTLVPAYQMKGQAWVSFRLAFPPPESLTYDTARNYMLKQPEGSPFLGLGYENAVVAVNLDADSPHILVTAGTGGGKSILVRLIAVQVVRMGGTVDIMDIKRVSHDWAEGIPGITIHRNVADIHTAIVANKRLTEQRYDDMEKLKVPTTSFRRHVQVVEEMNATSYALQEYWEETKERGDPKRSPAVSARGYILFSGRACRVHEIAIAQSGTARTMGGPELRENYGTRALARYTVQAWRMLCPEVWPMPRKSRIPGRWQIVESGVARETQVAYLTDEEAREYAGSSHIHRS